MAQIYTITPRRAAMWAGIESVFGTAASTTRVHPLEGTIELGFNQTELENPALRTRLDDYQDPTLGLRGGTVKASFWLHPAAAQLDTTTTATTPWLGVLLRSALGGEFPTSGTANAGNTVTSGGGAAITVTSAATFSKGAFALPQVANVTEPAFVSNIAGSVLTVTPAISNATASTATIFNAYNYYFTQAASPTLTLEFALADDTTQQWRGLGCVCTGLEIETTRDALIKLTFTWSVADWQDAGSATTPGGLGSYLSVTQASNPMAGPMPMTGVQLILQPTATTTYPAAFYDAPEFKLSLDLGQGHAPTLGGTQGKAAAMRTGGRPVAKATIKAFPDLSAANTGTTTPYTWWTSRTPLQMQLRAQTGSGATKRWAVFHLPTCVLVNKPAPDIAIDSVEHYQFELRSKLDTLVSSPTTDIHYASFRMMVG